MAAVLVVPPYLQFFDQNGIPLAGGLVYTYAAGTTTPQATYTDASGTTPAANPIVLDSAGRAVIWGNGSYKFLVKTSAGVNVTTPTDNVTVFAAQGATDVPMAAYTIKGNATGASATPTDLTPAQARTTIGVGSAYLGPVTVTNAATLDITSLMSNSYNQYELILEGIVPATNNTNLLMRVSQNNGSTFIAGSGYYYDTLQINTGASSYVTGTTQAQAIVANGLGFNLTSYYFQGNFIITATAGGFWMKGSCLYRTGSGVTVNNLVGIQSDNGGVNALRFYMSSGNITGTARLYGLSQ